MEEFAPSVQERVAKLQQICEGVDRAMGCKGEQLTPWDEVARNIAESDCWWAELEATLNWQPIAAYERPSASKRGLAMFRNGETAAFGAWTDEGWTHISAHGRWPMDFEPSEFAVLPAAIERDYLET